MDTAFVIGNGESRTIFPLELLKNHGTIYGCNAIYRDNPNLCHKIVSVNPEMIDELLQAKNKNKISPTTKIYSKDDLPKFSYVLPKPKKNRYEPETIDPFRFWFGSGATGRSKKLDFAKSRGSGCSAVHLACHDGHKNIFIIGFDILGARQWESPEGQLSRIQNNIYKNSRNYPDRSNMKAYLKFEWIYQLRQLAIHYHDKNFYYINRLEYLERNVYLHDTMKDIQNFKYGIYADLKKFVDTDSIRIKWKRY